MNVRIIKSKRDVVAVCDSELIGKRFEEGKMQLDIKESFFSGKEMNEEETIKVLEKMADEDATFNIIGEKSIEAALKAGIIAEESVCKIQGIPFVLILL
jgi:uncharacterized protein